MCSSRASSGELPRGSCTERRRCVCFVQIGTARDPPFPRGTHAFRACSVVQYRCCPAGCEAVRSCGCREPAESTHSQVSVSRLAGKRGPSSGDRCLLSSAIQHGWSPSLSPWSTRMCSDERSCEEILAHHSSSLSACAMAKSEAHKCFYICMGGGCRAVLGVLQAFGDHWWQSASGKVSDHGTK